MFSITTQADYIRGVVLPFNKWLHISTCPLSRWLDFWRSTYPPPPSLPYPPPPPLPPSWLEGSGLGLFLHLIVHSNTYCDRTLIALLAVFPSRYFYLFSRRRLRMTTHTWAGWRDAVRGYKQRHCIVHYEQSLLPLRVSRARRTRKRGRKSRATWKRDAFACHVLVWLSLCGRRNWS